MAEQLLTREARATHKVYSMVAHEIVGTSIRIPLPAILIMYNGTLADKTIQLKYGPPAPAGSSRTIVVTSLNQVYIPLNSFLHRKHVTPPTVDTQPGTAEITGEVTGMYYQCFNPGVPTI